MTNPIELDATALLEAFRSRRLSPLEAMQAVTDHIARREPELGGLYAFDPERSLTQARLATERWAQGRLQGALEGVPMTIKEMVATAGLPVPMGTAAGSTLPAKHDAPPAARLFEAGAIMVAKTSAPDYGMASTGLSSFHTLARNPWDPATNPGGSSAGAGTAGAAGFGPLHLGTDIGGSIRLPAAWCGLVGLKPSLGRVPIDPYYIGRCAGPMTRTVVDAALMMMDLTRPDARDATSLPYEAIDWQDLSLDISGRRIGLMLEPGCGLPVEAPVLEAVEAAARAFEKAGATIVAAPPVMTRAMLDGINDYWRARAWADIRLLAPEMQQRILPYILTWAKGGAGIDGPTAILGFNQTMAMRASCAALMTEVDAVLSPTAPILSFPADWASPLNDPERPFEHIVFTLPWNMSEQPAISVPCGMAGRTPVGLQIIGRRFADLDVLRLARFVEQWRGPMHFPFGI